MAATAPASSADLLDLIRKSHILPAERLLALPALSALPPEPTKAATALVREGFVTKFQATQLLAGRHKGFRIGPYVIQDMLGRGGMGAVYLAVHLELQRKVAIKVLAPGKGDDHRLALERFLREARAAAALDHPNIVRIFDVARHNEAPYLVMEYVEGETLQQLVDRDTRVPFEVAAEFVAQAAAGLQHAHEKGFVHRDIKPGNMIRDRFGAVKILDMGLARSASDRDKLTEKLDEGAVVGTADFIAPEQAINSPDVDGRADIYALGATLYTLIAGKTPFAGNTTQKLMQHQMKSAPSLVEAGANVPPELSAVVAKMLAKKPGARFQTAAEVVAALEPWAGASARVVAGLSQTSLGASNSGTNLRGRAADSARQLLGQTPPPRGPSDSAVDPSASDRPTGVLSAEDTLRDPAAPGPVRAAPRRRAGLIAGLSAALLVAVGACVALALSGGKRPEPVAEVKPDPQPQPQPQPHPHPQPEPPPQPPGPGPKAEPPKPEPPKPAGPVRLASDFAALKPFVVRSGLTADPVDASKKTYRLVSQSGPGALPAGWLARCWNAASEMEVFADADGPALGVRNVRGPGSAMLFTPRFDAPSGVVRVRLEYSAAVPDKTFAVKFKADDQRPAWELFKPAAGGPEWRTEEITADLRGASGGYIEFHNSDPGAGNAVRVRAVTVTEPNPASPDRVVFKLDAFDLPGFKTTKTGQRKTGGEDEPKIKGVYFGGWKPESESEWVCGPVAGAKAIGITNLNDVVSAQIGLDFETHMGLKFAPGQIVRVRVTYRTAGKGRGSAYVQNLDDRKTPDRVTLPNSNTEWKTVELVTARGSSPLRCLVDTTEKGAGNTLFVRTVTVAEVGAPRPVVGTTPAPAPKVDRALDPATWAEGKTVYALDLSKVPAFRTQKEKGLRRGGDAEQLPPGVSCQCWKEGAVGDFRCDTLDGAPALGVTNLNDEKSGQFVFSLEGALKLRLDPGTGYRVKLTYRTANDATGALTVHVVPGYKGVATAPLGGPADKWKTASASFVRPPAADMVELRMVVDNTSVGEGNTVWIRAVEIVELTPPKK